VFAAVTAKLRGVPGSVQRVRRVEETGRWEIEVEISPPTGQTALAVGAVEIRGVLDGDAETIEAPVYVR
jgi:hypothetical protein